MEIEASGLVTASFTSGERHLLFRTAVITGVCRSGKTLLGNLVATARAVEHADEPWLPMMLPMMVDQGIIDARRGRDMFITYTVELFREMALLRAANFRPQDLSSIWNQKSPAEIFARLSGMNSRQDVRRYIEERRPLLLYNLADTLPFADFFGEALPGCRIIHMVRRGCEVAGEIVAKRWFSDEQLLVPLNAQIYRPFERNGREYHLPWWVARGEEPYFLDLSEFSRALLYWCALVERGSDRIGRMAGEGRCLVVRYEDLLRDPEKVVGVVLHFLDLEGTELTLAKVRGIRPAEPAGSPPADLPRDLLERAERLYLRLGYDPPSTDG